MDPLSAISLASSLVAFLDFGGKLLSDTLRIYISVSGDESRSVALSSITADLNVLSDQIEQRLRGFRKDNNTLTVSEEKLASLCRDCQIVTTKIHGALDDVKSKGASNIDFPSLNGLLKALRAVWSRNKIVALEERLAELRQEIVVAVLVCIWEEAKNSNQQDLLVRERLDRILNAVTPDDKTTRKFADELADIPSGNSEETKRTREGVIEALGTLPQYEFGRRLAVVSSDLAGQQRLHHVQMAILDDLQFQGMDNREDAIPEAHRSTFNWIFSSEPNASTSTVSPDKIAFPTWLEENVKKIFWITGKPGSGKSTLMKYLGQHQSVMQHLQVWAKGLPLLHPAFYFWSAGNDLQKSLEGLLRSILYQCLLSHPELISSVASRRWWILSVLGTNAKFPGWSLKELKKSIHTLAAENGKSLRLALFIDGLDEFAGDHESVTKFIWELSNEYGVKFCVASRPWNVFADSFRQEPTLTMQDLTKGDIGFFIQAEFNNSPGFQELQDLFPDETAEILQELERKAEGVFLWVNLVVRSLLEILREEPRLSLIRQTLSDLPTDLELLYNAIWRTIDLAKIGSSSRLFQLAMALDVGVDGQAGQPSCDAVTIWLAFEADTLNKDFSLQTIEAERSVKAVVTRILSSLTRGILEVSPMGRVNFLHRTARDWISKPGTWEDICSMSPPGFDSKLAATEALALEMTNRASKIPKDLQDFSASIARILCYASEVVESNSSTPKLVKVLDRLDQEIPKIANSITYPADYFEKQAQPIFLPVSEYSSSHWSMILYRQKCPSLERSLLDLAALFAVLPYVKAKVSHDRSLVGNKHKRLSLVETAALGNRQDAGMDMARVSWYLFTVPYPRRLEMVRFLLEKGANPKQISGANELIRGNMHQFFALGMGRAQRPPEEEQYWSDLSALLSQYWGSLRSLKVKLQWAKGRRE